jgi:dTDP-4-dehydrorhamnose reductase
VLPRRTYSASSVSTPRVALPTYAGDLGRVIARIAADAESRLPYGTYHAVGGAVTRWHGFAEAIEHLPP